MKISKLFAITLQLKTRLIFFAIASTYNLLLGLYLKDFLVLSPTLTVFYLISVLPTLFLIVAIKTKTMRAVVYISLSLIVCMNIAYAICCRRAFPFLALIPLAMVFMYFIAFSDNTGKDKPMTKINVLIVFVLIISLLFSSYILVYKHDKVSLSNGQATLWDTNTVELANKICADCDTDEENVIAIYEWMTHNFEYDYDCDPVIQYFNVHKTLRTRKGICYDFGHLFAAFCRSQNIPCYVVDGDKRENVQYHHTWNRVYFNGSWWNIDVTFDIVQTKTQGELYGFRTIDGAFVENEEFFVTKIY